MKITKKVLIGFADKTSGKKMFLMIFYILSNFHKEILQFLKDWQEHGKESIIQGSFKIFPQNLSQ